MCALRRPTRRHLFRWLRGGSLRRGLMARFRLRRFYSFRCRRTRWRSVGYEVAKAGHRQDIIWQQPLGLAYRAIDARAVLASQIANVPVTLAELQLAMPR